MSDAAPVVYDEDGNPMKVRVLEGECEGDVSGEGHYGYNLRGNRPKVTVVFEEADDE